MINREATEFEEPYLNIYGQTVSWKFIEVVDRFVILDQLITGAELYSCFHVTPKNETADEFIGVMW